MAPLTIGSHGDFKEGRRPGYFGRQRRKNGADYKQPGNEELALTTSSRKMKENS